VSFRFQIGNAFIDMTSAICREILASGAD